MAERVWFERMYYYASECGLEWDCLRRFKYQTVFRGITYEMVKRSRDTGWYLYSSDEHETFSGEWCASMLPEAVDAASTLIRKRGLCAPDHGKEGESNGST